MATWLRTDLAGYARDILGQGRLGERRYSMATMCPSKLEGHWRAT